MTKVCSMCKQEKELSEFHKNNNRPSKTHAWCKECVKVYRLVQYNKDPEKIKNKTKEWRLKNPQKVKDYKLKYNLENYELNRIREKIYKEKNKDRAREVSKKYQKNKLKNNLEFKITNNLRARVSKAIKSKNGKKSYKTFDLIGCTVSELKYYIESQFKENMSWENYNKTGWHLDHIIPCKSFDLTNIEEQKRCFHYSNLQPLWAEENYKKGAKYEQEI